VSINDPAPPITSPARSYFDVKRQRDAAFDLLRRIASGFESGALDVPDVIHAVEAEIAGLLCDHKPPCSCTRGPAPSGLVLPSTVGQGGPYQPDPEPTNSETTAPEGEAS
jgi:hypothetical protein